MTTPRRHPSYSLDWEPSHDLQDTRLLTLNYARGMRRRERGVKVWDATSCAGRWESLVVLEVRGRGWDR